MGHRRWNLIRLGVARGTDGAADTTAPTVVLSSTAAATVTGPFDVTLTASEVVTLAGTLIVTNGSASAPVDSGDGLVWTATVTPAAEGTVSVQAGAGVFEDGAGNPSTASHVLSRTVVLYSQRVLATEPAHLIAYYMLAEPNGSLSALDSSGNGFDGGHGASVEKGFPGIGDGRTAARFDENGDWINLNNTGAEVAFDPDEGTLLYWFRFSDLTLGISGNSYPNFTGDNPNKMYGGRTTDNRMSLNFQRSSVNISRSSNVITNTDWHCFAATWSYSLSELRVFLDGVQQGAVVSMTQPWTHSGTWAFFSISLWTNSLFGDLAHWAMWDTPLLPAQVADLSTVSPP